MPNLLPNEKANDGKNASLSLQIYCQELKDVDTFSKSDPKVEVWVVDCTSHTRVKNLGKTETIMNNLNPFFCKRIMAPAVLPDTQMLEFIVSDADGLCDDALGKAYMPIDLITKAGLHGYNASVGKGNGRITVIAHEGGQGNLLLNLRGTKIKSMDWFGKSDPYVTINQGGRLLYKTEHVNNTKNPTWNSFELYLGACNPDHEVQVIVYDHDDNSSDDYIGECTFVPNRVIKSECSREISFISSKTRKVTGMLLIDNCRIVGVPKDTVPSKPAQPYAGAVPTRAYMST